ncbi:uncharacterized protein LOC116248907 isoform X2 [Nymphaea colorata]|uniref:uncharacterized protein LOC116248907 isoform X2 n=1 Tax=Nymphaea colorata TaxID=210225 RepID=UPI00129DCA81|nr:uncharacterized protein LOC116248907 isoform X2 [Nymphaea colorata]
MIDHPCLPPPLILRAGLTMIVISRAMGFVSLLALSGGIFYVALKAHQQLVSDFNNQIRRELAQKKRRPKIKRVRFADDVLEPSSDNQAYRKRRPKMTSSRLPAINEREHEGGDVPPGMPLNRVALYRGMREDRIKRGLLH